MSRGKTTEVQPEPTLPELSEQTRLEMEAGRKTAAANAAAQAHAEAARAHEAAAAAAKDAEEKRKQAEDKLRVIAEAEAAHAAKVSVAPSSSV
jgi:hypothetical protein